MNLLPLLRRHADSGLALGFALLFTAIALWMPAWQALEMATLGAARALGLDSKIGSLPAEVLMRVSSCLKLALAMRRPVYGRFGERLRRPMPLHPNCGWMPTWLHLPSVGVCAWSRWTVISHNLSSMDLI